jgi:hypothetical protein
VGGWGDWETGLPHYQTGIALTMYIGIGCIYADRLLLLSRKIREMILELNM